MIPFFRFTTILEKSISVTRIFDSIFNFRRRIECVLTYDHNDLWRDIWFQSEMKEWEREIYIYVRSMEISPIPIFVILIERNNSCLTMNGLLMFRKSSNMTRMKNAFTTSFKLRWFRFGGSFASRFRVFPTASSFPALHASLATFKLAQQRRIFLWLVVPSSCRVLLYFRFCFFF